MEKKKRSSSWLRSIVLIFTISFLILPGLLQPHASQDLAQVNSNHYRAANSLCATSQNFFQQSSFHTITNNPTYITSQTTLNQIGAGPLTQQTNDIERPYKQDEVLVKFKPYTAQSTANAVMNTLQVHPVKHYRMVDIHLTRTPLGKSVEETVRQLKKNPSVEYAEPNYIWYVDEIIPDDPDFGLLWGLNNTGQTGGTVDADIDAPEAWELQTGKQRCSYCSHRHRCRL